jgi:hypothetical protein
VQTRPGAQPVNSKVSTKAGRACRMRWSHPRSIQGTPTLDCGHVLGCLFRFRIEGTPARRPRNHIRETTKANSRFAEGSEGFPLVARDRPFGVTRRFAEFDKPAYCGIQLGPMNSRNVSGVAHGAAFVKRFTQAGPAPIFTRSGVNSGDSVLAISA